MNRFATAALLAGLSLTAGAVQSSSAMPVAPVAPLVAQAPAEKAAFVFSESLIPGRPSRLDRLDSGAAREAVESYFDYDALITLGAVALAGGAMASIALAAARRKSPPPPDAPEAVEPDWRESVFQTLQADLWKYTDGYRRAA